MKKYYKLEDGEQKLLLEKKVDKTYVVQGDLIRYEIILTNKSEDDLKQLMVSEVLSEQVRFVAGSIKLDGEEYKEESILAGVFIDTLEIGRTKKITFEARVISEEVGTIEEQAKCQFVCEIEEDEEEYEIVSNICQLEVLRPYLRVTKKATPNFVVLGDLLDYHITIQNQGSVDVYNVFFKDTLPRQIKFLADSFVLNGRGVNGVELEKGIRIGDMKRGEEVTISYTGKIKGTKRQAVYIDEPEVIFKYRLADGTSGERKSEINLEEAGKKVDVGLMTFKDMCIEKYLTLSDPEKSLQGIMHATAQLKINHKEMIKSQVGKNLEGQILTGKQLGIRGTLEVTVEYISKEEMIYTASYQMPFSTYVILPRDYQEGTRIDTVGTIENIYHKVVDSQSFFISVGCLIHIKRIDG